MNSKTSILNPQIIIKYVHHKKDTTVYDSRKKYQKHKNFKEYQKF